MKLKITIFILFLIAFSITAISVSDKQLPIVFGGKELNSPSDWISEKQIKVYPNKIILDIQGASWAGFTDTNSMDPFIDKDSNVLQIKPSSAELIQVGDVISYKFENRIIIHRVILVSEDETGRYYIVKGDNNELQDPIKVRFNDITGVVVAVIY